MQTPGLQGLPPSDIAVLCNSDFCQFLNSLARSGFRPINDLQNAELFDTYWTKHSRPEPENWTGRVAYLRTLDEMKNGTCVACKFIYDQLHSQIKRAIKPGAKVLVEGFENSFGREVYFQAMNGPLPLTFLTDAPTAKADAARLVKVEEVDYGCVRRWIQHCDEYHKDHCGKADLAWNNLEVESDKLRVYDIQKQCLTNIDWLNTKYVSLSYVWGSASPPRLMKADESLWMEPGALKTKLRTFPKVIFDAIEVSRRLEVRYFWFDSLCLIQDDPDGLLKGINTMHLIYERAYLTIVAAHGADANSGLPGVSVPRQPQNVRHIGNGVTLVPSCRGSDIGDSKWSTRGWTFQEQILSRRILAFTRHQVSYFCCQSSFSEESCMDLSPEDRVGTMTLMVNFRQSLNNYMRKPFFKGKIFLLLFRLITKFSDRDLSFDSDTIRAMTGVFQRTSSATEGHILQGLPTAVLPISLMFLLEGRQSAKPRRKPDFPSYSWAGWEGTASWDGLDGSVIVGIDYQHTEQWLQKANWIEWAVLTKDHSGEPFKVPGQLQVSGGALPRHLLERSGSQSNISAKSWAENDPCPDRSWIKYPCLLFSTLLFRARILPAGKRRNKRLFEDVLSWDMEDTYGQKCGAACLDGPSQTSTAFLTDCLVISQRWTLGVEGDYDDDEEDEEDEIDSQDSSEPANPAEENVMTDPVSDPENEDQYNILIVEEVLEGVYERRGIGWVQSYAITRSFSPGSTWKQIILA